ncbi:hypothetical protein EJV47_12295 [Hymenobacter gummosus]|uniref:Uncharacterized protein n=1 Tax=Hymenobacter gummosus TaxID=1776032 RepID=A0A431U2L3_9BACT|nr:hypothetical protein [Hymenobacter gummosus]RTQ49596.1 hypothetical protein EJV47_12295 [Hymenobacter gummosus]
MPEPAAAAPAALTWPRLLLAALLLLLLFWVGTYDEPVFAWLSAAWQRLLAALGLDGLAARLQQGTSGLVTKRSLPTVITYSLAYTGVCLLIIGLLVPRRALRTAFWLYGGVFAASAVLVLVGKAAGDVAWLYKLGRQLIDFIVSPLPVAALVPLLRWYYAGAQSTSQAHQ